MMDGVPMQHDKLQHLIQWHLEHHKNMGIQDVYKLLYQGLFGAEHLLHDVERAKAYLEDEWQRVPALADEKLCEPASLDGTIVRANIRRCKADGISLTQLWEAFYSSVAKVKADTEQFETMWFSFATLCRLTKLPFDAARVFQFGQEAQSQHWPAKHHTPEYREANYPAYRVLLKREFERCINMPLDENDIFY
jgi:hypothetical protein